MDNIYSFSVAEESILMFALQIQLKVDRSQDLTLTFIYDCM